MYAAAIPSYIIKFSETRPLIIMSYLYLVTMSGETLISWINFIEGGGYNMFKTILVPVVGFKDSIRAVDHCVEVAKRMEVEKIVLIHASAIPARVQSIFGKLGSLFIQMKDDLAETPGGSVPCQGDTLTQHQTRGQVN